MGDRNKDKLIVWECTVYWLFSNTAWIDWTLSRNINDILYIIQVIFLNIIKYIMYTFMVKKRKTMLYRYEWKDEVEIRRVYVVVE